MDNKKLIMYATYATAIMVAFMAYDLWQKRQNQQI